MLSTLRPSTTRLIARAFSTSSPASDVAKLTLVGRIAAAPVIKQTKTGKDFLIYKVATTDPYLPPKEGETYTPTTSWHTIFAYGPAVEKLAGIEPGSLVMAEATFTTESVKTDDGAYTTNIFAKHQKLSVLRKPYKGTEAAAEE